MIMLDTSHRMGWHLCACGVIPAGSVSFRTRSPADDHDVPPQCKDNLFEGSKRSEERRTPEKSKKDAEICPSGRAREQQRRPLEFFFSGQVNQLKYIRKLVRYVFAKPRMSRRPRAAFPMVPWGGLRRLLTAVGRSN